MKSWKRWTAVLLSAVLCLGLLAGCGGQEAGMSLSVCAGAAPESLDPIYATSTADQTILTHLYENLMQASTDESGALTASSGMAKSAESEVNVDGTVTWTFRLRSAKWSDGEKVTADDFVYAWQRLADPERNSPYASLLSIVAGYQEARESGDMSLLQVTAENDSTLVVVLSGSYEWFLTQVCTSTATLPLRRDIMAQWEPEETPEEEQSEEAQPESAEGESQEIPQTQTAPWWSDATALVTNGPYQVTGYTAGESLTATAYEDYYGRQNGPQTLTFRFADTAQDAWALYEAGTVDFVGLLPEEQLEARAEDEARPLSTELSTYVVLFNCAQDPFDEADVRRALALVLDRNTVAQAAGTDARAAEGLVPPGVPDSGGGTFRENGTLLDNNPDHYADACAQGVELLSQAGYDGGRGLGELEYLYVDQGEAAAVAQALCDMWSRELNLEVTARAVTEEELAQALTEGTFTLAGVELRPVANDPECFLMPWVSERAENTARYANSAYDTLLSIIASAQDSTARSGCLHDAEALLLEDGVVAPLYTTVTGWELRDTLTGLWRDGRGWFRFTGVVTRSA